MSAPEPGPRSARRIVRLPVPLLLSAAHSPIAVSVYGLVDALSAGRPCSAGRVWLAGRLGVSVATVGRALGELEREHGDTRVFLTSVRTARTARRRVVRAVGERYVDVPAWTVGMVPARAWRLYAALLWWRRADGTVGYSAAEIGRRLGCSRDVVTDDLVVLDRAGLLGMTRAPGRVSVLRPVGVGMSPGASAGARPVEVPEPARVAGCGEPSTCGRGESSGVAVVSHPSEVHTREDRTRGEINSPAVGELTSVGPGVGARPEPAAAGMGSSSPGRRVRPLAVPACRVSDVSAVLGALPADLRAGLPAVVPGRLVERVAAELGHRTAAELAARVERRWYARGYAADAARGRLRDPVAVAVALVRRDCPDLRCEDGQVLLDALTRETKPCPLCAERRARPAAADPVPTGTPPDESHAPSPTPTPPPAAAVLTASPARPDPATQARGIAACRQALATAARRVA